MSAYEDGETREDDGPSLDLAVNLSPDIFAALQAHLSCTEPTTRTSTSTGNTSTSTTSEIIEETPSSESFEMRQRSGRETNKQFAEKSYWDERFVEEENFEWLVSFKQCAEHVLPLLGPKESKILLVGVGSSSFSADLYDAGYHNLVNLDFSEVIIEKMKKENDELRPKMQWVCMDMLEMKAFPDASFDVVLDKAAMDALVVDEGDVWDPREAVVRTVHQNCLETRRVLRNDGGRFIMISFMQPHFRTKYLKGYRIASLNRDSSSISIDEEAAKPCASHTGWCEAYRWNLSFQTIDTEGGCFSYFLYVMDASNEELSVCSKS